MLCDLEISFLLLKKNQNISVHLMQPSSMDDVDIVPIRMTHNEI